MVLEARHEEVIVGFHVDGARAVAAELGGQGLRRDDPDLARAGHEQVLDLAVARQDPEAAHDAAVQAAGGRRHLEQTALAEIGLVAAREAQRLGIVALCKPGNTLAAVDQIARIGARPAPRPGKIAERRHLPNPRLAQHQLERALIVRHRLGAAACGLDGVLDLVRQIGGLLRRVQNLVTVFLHPLDVALADPLGGEVRRRAPDQRRILVEQARKRGAAALRRLHDVGDEKADVFVLAQTAHVEGRVEQRRLVGRHVARLQQAPRLLARRASGDDRQSIVE